MVWGLPPTLVPFALLPHSLFGTPLPLIQQMLTRHLPHPGTVLL